ncbi:MAG TPA: hypothetical protein VFC87_05200 [Perlabentimonas sp.]|nr:hypothetical protein [Perlabentimonas sp.]
MVLQASYDLASNSVLEKQKERFQNTLDEYYTLMGEYPETKHSREAEKIYANTIKVTDNK